MTFRFEVDFRDLDRLQRDIITFARIEALKRAQSIVIADINRKTDAGLDADEQPFAPYTKRYAERRKSMGLPTSRVDLRVTNRLRGFALGIVGDMVTVGSEYAGQAAGLQKKRTWIAVGGSTATRVGDALTNDVDKRFGYEA